MPARSVCLVALSLSEAGPRRFGRQASVMDMPHHPVGNDSCVPTLIHMYEPPHERPHVHSHRTPEDTAGY